MTLCVGCSGWGSSSSRQAKAIASSSQSPPAEGAPYDFEQLIQTAREAAANGEWSDDALAGTDTSSAPLPEVLKAMDYDGHMGILFEQGFAARLSERTNGYTLAGFHRGWLHQDPVHIEIVTEGISRPWSYQPEAFTFGAKSPKPDASWGDLGWAGMRISRPWREGSGVDELLVILGASYFRALGEGSSYGASGRLIAVNTGIPNFAESFPRITCIWVHQNSSANEPLTVDGLIDGEHLTAAFRMVIHPGATTAIDVDLHLFTRKPIRKLGLAPITSMFLFGPETDPRFRDERPEVHDNDGLLAHSPGKVYWQPLRNPYSDRTTRLTGSDTTGFGLMQRERRFDRYLDPYTQYELRPDVWVRPTNDWPAGEVELLELSRLEEKHDNIGTYYVVEDVPAGKSFHISYTVSFGSPIAAVNGVVGKTSEPADARSMSSNKQILEIDKTLDYKTIARADRVVFSRTPWPHWSILFDGPVLQNEYADKSFTVVVKDKNGETIIPSVAKLPDGRWRVHLSDALAYPVDVHLEDFGQTLSETVRLQEPNP